MGDRDSRVASASGTAYSRDEMPNLEMADENMKPNMARLQGMGAGMATDRPMPHMSARTPLNTSWDHVVLEISRDRLVDLENALKQPKYSQLLMYSFEPGGLDDGEAPGAFSADLKARLVSGVAAAKEEASASEQASSDSALQSAVGLAARQQALDSGISQGVCHQGPAPGFPVQCSRQGMLQAGLNR